MHFGARGVLISLSFSRGGGVDGFSTHKWGRLGVVVEFFGWVLVGGDWSRGFLRVGLSSGGRERFRWRRSKSPDRLPARDCHAGPNISGGEELGALPAAAGHPAGCSKQEAFSLTRQRYWRRQSASAWFE